MEIVYYVINLFSEKNVYMEKKIISLKIIVCLINYLVGIELGMNGFLESKYLNMYEILFIF